MTDSEFESLAEMYYLLEDKLRVQLDMIQFLQRKGWLRPGYPGASKADQVDDLKTIIGCNSKLACALDMLISYGEDKERRIAEYRRQRSHLRLVKSKPVKVACEGA